MGLGGVLLMVLPGSSGRTCTRFRLVFLAALLSALYYALYNIMTRLMRETASTLAMTNVQHVGYMFVGVIFALMIFLPPFDVGALASQNENRPLSFGPPGRGHRGSNLG